MEGRLIAAYALTALLALAAASLVGWLRYNSDERKIARRRLRERESRERRQAATEANEQ